MDIGVCARIVTNLANGLVVMDRNVCQTFLLGYEHLAAQYFVSRFFV